MTAEATVFIVNDDPAIITLVTEAGPGNGLQSPIMALGRCISSGAQPH